MNNLNLFLLFSSLIYFKLTEDKKGNLKVVVGFLSLYLFYRVLTNVEEGLEEDDCILGSIYVPASSPERAKCILGEIDCDADPNHNPDCLQLFEICQKDGDCRDNKKCYEGKCVECLDEASLTRSTLDDGPSKDNFRCNETGETCVYDSSGERKCIHQVIGMTCSTRGDCPDPPNNSCYESQDESQDESQEEKNCICKPSLNFCGYFKSPVLTDECKQICDTDSCCEFDTWVLIGMIVVCSIVIVIVAVLCLLAYRRVRFWKGAYDTAVSASNKETQAQMIERVFSGDYRDPAYEFLEVPECKLDLSGGDTPQNVGKIMKCKGKLETMMKEPGWEGPRDQVTAELEKINWALEEMGKLPTPTAPPKAAARAIGESYKLTQAAEEHGLAYKPQRSHLTKNKVLTVLAALLFLLSLVGVVVWLVNGAPGSALTHF